MSAAPSPTQGNAPVLTRAGVARGVTGFVLLAAAGLTALFVLTFDGEAAAVVRGLSPGFLLLALLSSVADMLVGGLRFHVFLRKMVPGTPLSLPVRADLAGRFLGSVTPSQTGGGPGQIYVLYKGGIPLPVTLAVLMVNLVASLAVLVVSGGAALWIFHGVLTDGAIRHLALWGAVVFAGLLGFLLLSVTRPQLLVRPVVRLGDRLAHRPGRFARGVRRLGRILEESAENYQASSRDCIRKWPALPVVAVLLTGAMYLNKFTLAWFVMRGLGVDGPYLTTVAVQALLHFVLYVAPTPGGSGIAEVSTGAVMSVVVPTHLLAPFTLVFRFLLGYLPATVGAVALAATIRPPAAAPGGAESAPAPAPSPAAGVQAVGADGGPPV